MLDKEINARYNDKARYAIVRTALGNKYAHPEMVFPSGQGNYRDRNSVLHSLKRMTKGTEFEDMTLHKLRHLNTTKTHLLNFMNINTYISLQNKEAALISHGATSLLF